MFAGNCKDEECADHYFSGSTCKEPTLKACGSLLCYWQWGTQRSGFPLWLNLVAAHLAFLFQLELDQLWVHSLGLVFRQISLGMCTSTRSITTSALHVTTTCSNHLHNKAVPAAHALAGHGKVIVVVF